MGVLSAHMFMCVCVQSHSFIKFDKNSCVVLGEDLKPRASRVLHPLPRELRNTVYSKLLFLSDVIL
jgi:ribosomal protein L14